MIHKDTNLEVYLTRHAESVANQSPHIVAGRSSESPLSEKGQQQARRLGKVLKQDAPFDAVFTSPLLRSSETCKIACEEAGVIIEAEVAKEIEEFTQGDWEGAERKDLYSGDRLTYIEAKGYLLTPPNGESQRMVERRVSNWFEDKILYNESYIGSPKKVLVFTHGLVIKCFLHYVMHFDDRLIYRVRLDNASVTKLRFTSRGWFIDYIDRS